MNTKILSLFSVVILFTGCNRVFVDEWGNGDISSEDRTIGSFDKIEANGNFDIILEQGDEEGLVITTDENLFAYIETSVSGNTLEIFTNKHIRSDEGIKCYVRYKSLQAINSGGACSFVNETKHKGEDLKIELSGAGAIDMDLELESLELEISGAGAADLKGTTKFAHVRMSGAGGLSGKEFEVESCKIRISGVGGAELSVLESIDAKVSGVGGVTYYGNPENVYSNVSGIGTIKRGN